jgi:hypothetical protein
MNTVLYNNNIENNENLIKETIPILLIPILLILISLFTGYILICETRINKYPNGKSIIFTYTLESNYKIQQFLDKYITENKKFITIANLKYENIQNVHDKYNSEIISINASNKLLISELELKYSEKIEKLKFKLNKKSEICSKLDTENLTLQTKLKDIENILIKEEYVVPKYLKYNNDNISILKSIGRELSLRYLTQYRTETVKALAYTIRTTEQLNHIINIIKPVYTNGYETEEMNYSSDT